MAPNRKAPTSDDTDWQTIAPKEKRQKGRNEKWGIGKKKKFQLITKKKKNLKKKKKIPVLILIVD